MTEELLEMETALAGIRELTAELRELREVGH